MMILATATALCFLVTAIALIWLIFRAFKRSPLWGAAVAILSPVSAVAYGIKYWREDKKPFLCFTLPFVTAVTLVIYSFSTFGVLEVAQFSIHVHRSMPSQEYTDREALKFAYANYPVVEESSPFRHNQRKLDLMATFISRHVAIMTNNDKQEIDFVLQDMGRAPKLAFRQKLELETMRSQIFPAFASVSAPVSALEPVSATADENTNSLPAASADQQKAPVPSPKRYRLAYISIQPKDAGDYVGASVKVIRKNKTEQEYILTDTSPGSLHLVKKKRGGSFEFKLRNRDIDKLRVLVKQAY